MNFLRDLPVDTTTLLRESQALAMARRRESEELLRHVLHAPVSCWPGVDPLPWHPDVEVIIGPDRISEGFEKKL